MNVLTVDFQSDSASKFFVQSLRETGFAVLKNHPLSVDLIQSVYEEWEAFFRQDENEKGRYLFHSDTQDGFFPKKIAETAKGNTQKDLKEFYQFYPWGQFPSHMSRKTHDLYEQMATLASQLLFWVEAGLPLEIASALDRPLGNMIQDSRATMLRIIHYPPLEGSEPAEAVRAAAHEDINHITILPAATASGLQVMDHQGNWYDVNCDPGTLVINSADMLQECTRGYFRSTTHRVCNPMDSSQNTSRLSMPLFLHPRSDVRLSERYTAKSYLEERLLELGLREKT